MLRTYLAGYIRHNRAAVVALAAISFVAAVLLGLVVGVGQLMVSDYLARMAYLGETPQVSGSTIAFVAVTALSALAIVLMLKSAFDVSMSARIRQLGLLKTIGARDAQVKRLLLAEGCAVSLPAACVGVLAGMVLSLALVHAVLALTVEHRVYEPVVELSPLAVLFGLFVAAATIACSALLPARRLGKISIVRAIDQGADDYGPTRRPGFMARAFGRLLGVEAAIAMASVRSRRRSMRTANASIALALLAFVTFINFETLSHLSTQVTYFERYAGVWDVRVTVESAAGSGIGDVLASELRAMDGVAEVTQGDPYRAGSDDLFVNVLTTSPAAEERLVDELAERFAGDEGVNVLGLREEAARDERARTGLRIFVSAFAGVLACIGIADVFASVLGRVPSRRREVAQLLAAGITRKQVRRMFAAESVYIIARPLMWTMVLNIGVVIAAVQVSPVSLGLFAANMPLASVAAFSVACWLFVRLAYCLGERAILRAPSLALDVA